MGRKRKAEDSQPLNIPAPFPLHRKLNARLWGMLLQHSAGGKIAEGKTKEHIVRKLKIGLRVTPNLLNEITEWAKPATLQLPLRTSAVAATDSDETDFGIAGDSIMVSDHPGDTYKVTLPSTGVYFTIFDEGVEVLHSHGKLSKRATLEFMTEHGARLIVTLTMRMREHEAALFEHMMRRTIAFDFAPAAITKSLEPAEHDPNHPQGSLVTLDENGNVKAEVVPGSKTGPVVPDAEKLPAEKALDAAPQASPKKRASLRVVHAAPVVGDNAEQPVKPAAPFMFTNNDAATIIAQAADAGEVTWAQCFDLATILAYLFDQQHAIAENTLSEAFEIFCWKGCADMMKNWGRGTAKATKHANEMRIVRDVIKQIIERSPPGTIDTTALPSAIAALM